MNSSGADPPDRADAMVLDLRQQSPEQVKVRRWCGDALADLTDEELGDVLLVVSELATNAYDHGESLQEIRMRRISHPCAVRLEVDDNSRGLPILGFSTINRNRGLLAVTDDAGRRIVPKTTGCLGHNGWAADVGRARFFQPHDASDAGWGELSVIVAA